MQNELAKHDLEYFERGGGISIQVKSTSCLICKASAVGPGYSRLMQKFGAPFPGHSHTWLAEKMLKKQTAE